MPELTTGQKIRQRRNDLGLTQAEAAARMGKSHSYWSDLERDRRAHSLATLVPVAAALGCRLSVLLVPLSK